MIAKEPLLITVSRKKKKAAKHIAAPNSLLVTYGRLLLISGPQPFLCWL